MNIAIRTSQPSSSWITAGLLTLFVVAFGIFANAHTQHETAFNGSSNGLMVEIYQTRTINRSTSIFRYH